MTLPFHIVDRTGWPSNYCELTVLSDVGYINNPELDDSLNLSITVKYPQTSLQLFTLSDTYNMNFYDTQEDIFSIKNTGSLIAKSIHLESDWFTFTMNNFDLEPGQSKNIGYIINPKISYSNETDKTYTKEVKITGNFPPLTQSFVIYIAYAEIVTTIDNNASTLKDYICDNFPEFCEPQIVYKYIDNGEAKFNVSYTENQVRRLYDLYYDFLDTQTIKDKQLTEYTDKIDSQLNIISNSTDNTNQDINNINTSLDNRNTGWVFFGWFIGMIIVGVLITILTLKYKEKFKDNFYSRYG